MWFGSELRVFSAMVICAATACTPQPQTIAFRSLESSGTAAFVCLSRRESDVMFTGSRNIKDCPDTDPVDGEVRQTFALVTQRTRGEVAVLAVNASDTESGKLISGVVVDEEPAVPGYNFLPVGAMPVDIVATPGSTASFVATAEAGKEGIYVVPSSCVTERDVSTKEPVRDITLWPACHLPSAPGKMTMLVDPPGADGSIRASCSEAKTLAGDGGGGDGGVAATDAGSAASDAATTETVHAQSGRACPALIETEQGPKGRRKLVVSLPDLGKLVVIDAQELANRPPGSFGACPIDTEKPLKAELPNGSIVQRLPPDLHNVFPNGLPHPPPPQNLESRPAGFAKLDDSTEHKLFIGDLQVPVIHVLDTSDPCRMTELPPLLPVSYFDPNRTVTATKLAVMDRLTLDGGKRFLYAIDQLGGGQVMMFDVSPFSTERTPIVRPRGPLIPFDSPDRIGFGQIPAVDVAFVTENPARSPDPATGTETLVKCDPTPGAEGPGTKYRPSIPDYTTGANPGELRGTFALIALSSGQIAVVDVEDLDAPCRRPLLPNRDKPSSVGGIPDEDFRGCVGDATNLAFTKDGTNTATSTPTVTTEASCRIVEQNRPRSANLVLTNGNRGVHAPAVLGLPKLVDVDGRGLPNDDTDKGREQPRMLGVNFASFSPQRPENRAQVFVGTDFFAAKTSEVSSGQNELVIDPALAKGNSVVLDLTEPRAYGGDESFTATYEGKLIDNRAAGLFTYPPLENAKIQGVALLRDTSLSGGFCAQGVEGMDIVEARAIESRTIGAKKIGVTDETLFRAEYADFAVITSELLADSEEYWKPGNAGSKCGGADPNEPGAGYLQCLVRLGTRDAPNPLRSLTIYTASRDTLTVIPKGALGPGERLEDLALIACCFPEPVTYDVRVSHEWLVKGDRVEHDIGTGGSPDFTCVRDPNPLRSNLVSRAFEVSCDQDNSPACLQKDKDPTKPSRPIIGPVVYVVEENNEKKKVQETRVCVVQDPTRDMQTIGAAVLPGCLFTSLKSNFVIYRGTKPSQEDMQFQWQVSGAFSPLLINLNVLNDANTSPQSLVPSPFPGTVMVADGGDKGLVVVDLRSFSPYPIY